MATYKVIQDIEAEDKLVGPLSLRQFIYAGIAALCFYLSFLCLSKHVGFLVIIFLPPGLFAAFFAFPWGKDQPTEVWALAKIRFMLKPRKRIWDQSGVKELVTITAPKKIEHAYTDGLSQTEVRSRLSALADTIDSRGWAIKNVNVNLAAMPQNTQTSDRLVEASSLPQEVNSIDVNAADDMLDEQANPVAQHFDSMIAAQSQAHRQQLIAQMQSQDSPASAAPASPPNNYWFLNGSPAQPPAGQTTFVDSSVVSPGSAQAEPPAAPQAGTPTAEEEAMVDKFKAENHSIEAAYGHMKVVKTPEQRAADERAAAAQAAAQKAAQPKVTPKDTAAIMNLANNDDLDVATLARQAKRQQSDDEVVISLH